MEEKNGEGKPLNQSGWYKHKETGATVELDITPGVGTPLIDAYIQVGFVPCEAPKVVSAPSQSGYTESTTKNGKIQYRNNGKLISKDEYEANN